MEELIEGCGAEENIINEKITSRITWINLDTEELESDNWKCWHVFFDRIVWEVMLNIDK